MARVGLNVIVGEVVIDKTSGTDRRCGTWVDRLLFAPGLRIGGGTDEIQRNTIGEQGLGLPPRAEACSLSTRAFRAGHALRLVGREVHDAHASGAIERVIVGTRPARTRRCAGRMGDRHTTEDWEPTLDDFRARRRASRAMGGEERLAKHRAAGKLDAHARIDRLLDPGSFQELGTLVGGEDAPADAVVIGSGRIDNRPVMVAAEDFTVKAGTISQPANSKRYRVAELAVLDRVPLVMMLEGAGFRADGRAHGRSPTDLLAQSRCSGRVPLVTAVLGSSAGHGALVAPMSDFTVMSRHAAIFTAGPPVVFESLGEQITKEDLGGPTVALTSGLIHNGANDDESALDLVRLYLRYFPQSAWSYPPDEFEGDIEPRLVPEMLDIVPRNGRRVYDMHGVVDVVFDADSCFEIQPEFGRSIMCALCRLGGHPVAVVANRPDVLAGSIDGDSADKAAHFITVADSFHLPIVFLSDNPGVLPGGASERRGILRSGARMYAAQTLATTPKFEVTVRKAYGFGSMVMGMIPFDGQSGVFALPGATMGAMGAAAMSRRERCRRGRGSEASRHGTAGLVPIGEHARVRRARRPARDPQHPPALARAGTLSPAGPGRARRSNRHHAMTWLTGLPEGETDWERLSALCPEATSALADVVAATWEETDPVLLELARLRIAKLLGYTAELARRSAGARETGLTEEKEADLAAWPTSPLFTARERACLTLVEQFVIDANGVTDAQVADVTEHLGAAGCYAFVEAVSVLEAFQRACLTLGIQEVPL